MLKGLIGQNPEFDPAGTDIGGVQGETKLPRIPVSAVVNRVNRKKTGFQVCLEVIHHDRDMLFQEISRFCAVFPPDNEGFPVVFQDPVDGGGANPNELFPDILGDMKGFPGSQMGHLLPHEWHQTLPALIPEKSPIDKNIWIYIK
jgi:hypothetical protein